LTEPTVLVLFSAALNYRMLSLHVDM